MFKHLFKLIWNKKKQNALLITEMLVSFLVIFAVFSMIVNYYRSYRKPMGFEYEHVWIINYKDALQTKNADSLFQYYESVRRMLKSMPEVGEVSFTGADVIFTANTNETGMSYNHKQLFHVADFMTEDSYKDVLGMKVVEGRWFNKSDALSKESPVVINETLKEDFFGKDNAVGKRLNDYGGDNPQLVIGVVEDMKTKGDYTALGRAIFRRLDTSSYQYTNNILVKVSPDADASFENRLFKAMTGAMKTADVEILHLSDQRKSYNKVFLIPMIVVLIVAGFLIINVALGLYGVLWYNINKRKGEIGLRRAIGASGQDVSSQFVSEGLVLATFSLIIGVFFGIQFPLLNVFNIPTGVYLMALALSVIFIYVLVLVCSLYPARQASAIYPAVALHED